MANKGGIITRKEVIEDESLEWGEVYEKSVQKAIDKNKEFTRGILELAGAMKSIKGAESNAAYIKAKDEERLATQKSILAIQEQMAAEKALEKTKQEVLRTRKLELDVQSKEEQSKKRSTQSTIEERVQNEVNNRVLKQAAMERLGLIGAYTKLNNSRTEAKNKLRDLIATENASIESIKKAQKEFDILDAKVKKADHAVNDFTKNVGNYPKIDALTSGLKNLVGAFGITAGIGLFATVTSNAVKIAREFDAEMTNLSAVAGKSRKDLAPLESQIRSVGKSSINGATDIAKLATELIKLGSTDEEAAKLLKPIDDLTVALKASAEDAASLVKGLLNAYGEGADQAARYTDILAAAANRTSLDFQGLRDALGYLAPTAKTLGLNLEQTASIIGVLADNNIKAESAGRLMATSFTRLATSGMTLEQALDQINKKQKEGANRLEILALAGKLFGAESAKLGLILANNREKMAGLNKEFENSAGSLKKLTNEQMKSFDNQLKNLSGAWEELILTIENGNGPISSFFASVLGSLGKWIEGVTFLIKSQKELNQESYSKEEQQAYDAWINSLNDLTKAEKLLQAEYNKRHFGDQNKQLIADNEKLSQQADELVAKIKGLSGGVGKAMLESDLDKVNEQIISNNLSISERKGILRAMGDIIKSNSKTEQEENAAIALSEEEKKKRQEEELKRRAAYFKLIQKMIRDTFDLEKFRLDRTRELNQEIVDDEKKTIDERIDAMYYVNQLSISLSETEAREKLMQMALEKDGLDKLSKAQQDAYVRSSEAKINALLSGKVAIENMTKAEILIYEQLTAKKEDIERKQLANKQKIVDSEVAIIQKKIDAEIQKQDTELNNAIEAENRKFKILRDGIFARGLLTDQENKLIEKLTEDHERQVFEIQKFYSKKKLQDQIDTLQKLIDNQDRLPDNERISAEERKKIEHDLSQAKRALSEADLTFFNENTEKRLFFETDAFKQIEEASMQLVDALQGFANALFDAKISKIDEEIAAEESKYNKQLELAGNDEAQKQLIQIESEKKREELEKKKRKEQHKQAVFNKALAITEAGINTAKAVTAALSAGPGVGLALAVITAAVAAIQLAAIIATPVPKYAKGRKGGPRETAMINDGGKIEVVEDKHGNAKIYPGYNRIVQLNEGDNVHTSIDDYQKLQRAAFMASIDAEGRRISHYQAEQMFDKHYNKELVDEMKLTRKAIEKQKPIIIQNKIDIPHKIWASKNTNWS